MSIPGGNFFNVHIIGSTIKVDLNVEHRFYKDFYSSSSADSFIRGGLDILLFSIASRVELNNSNKSFYEREIREWSSFLSNGLESLLKETSKLGINASSVQDEEDPSEFIDDTSEKSA